MTTNRIQRPEAKVIRVRFREGRNGREVLGFNLYLAPNDVWSGALYPPNSADSAPTQLVTSDVSSRRDVTEARRHLEMLRAGVLGAVVLSRRSAQPVAAGILLGRRG